MIQIDMNKICTNCRIAQDKFINKCTSPVCCLYLNDNICKNFNIPINIINENRNKLLNYRKSLL